MKGILKAAGTAQFKSGEFTASQVIWWPMNRLSSLVWGKERVGRKSKDEER